MPTKRSPDQADEQPLASYPTDLSTVQEVSEYRTTWIVSSLEVIRSAGLHDRYLSALRRIDREQQPGVEDAILSLVANHWLPISVAHAHYEACDTLGLSESDVLECMRTVDGGQVRRAWHAQIIAAAQKPDAAPWTLLPNIPKWWPRTANGGGLALYRLGPTQARFEYFGCRLFEIPFYGSSVRAVHTIFAGHFCKNLNVRLGPRQKVGQATVLLRWQ